jgi:hypothetical protein
MGDVVYKSESRIERIKGPFRRAYIPATADPVDFGVHGSIAQHYGVTGTDEVATTLDYIVAATGG